MVYLFTITVFLSASLLFVVQPMVAKTLLPIFGGGSSVWTTCMLFYQSVLLVGYLYAHVLLTRFSKKTQISIHIVVLLAALLAGVMFVTPVAPEGSTSFPVPWLLGQLAIVSGLPFFAISSAGPLIQGWFSRTGHKRAHDPYFLYAASNAGSLIGLLAYPFVVEPMLGLDEQRELWLIGLAVFALLALAGASLSKGALKTEIKPANTTDDEPITWKRRRLWIFLAFVPSSMLLGVTSYITTDIASFPLLWIIPLALYLVTMIVAFGSNAQKLVKNAARPMLIAVIAAMVLLIIGEKSRAGAPLLWSVLIQLVLLFVVGVYAHGRLAADRPRAEKLTEFFLMMSVGGALGGVFNGFVAPLIFPGAYEYHIALVAAVATIPTVLSVKRRIRLRWMMPAITVVYIGAVYLVSRFINAQPSWGDNELLVAGLVLLMLIAGPAVLMYMSWRDGIACALTLAVLLISVVITDLADPAIMHRSRTFYGVHTVERLARFYYDEPVRTHALSHGTTVHGIQIVEPELRKLPLTYYHPDGPIGRYFTAVNQSHPEPRRIGIIGLGTGALASYGRTGDTIVFYEIDPQVVRIAQDAEMFSYLADSDADIQIKIGDGRLNLERAQEIAEPVFDFLVVDAFSSDSIPVHLLTVEAVELYFDRLKPDGVLFLHISNRNMNISALCFSLGEAVDAYTLLNSDRMDPDDTERTIRYPSDWVALSRGGEKVERALEAGFRLIIESKDPIPAWTDQSSNILDILMW